MKRKRRKVRRRRQSFGNASSSSPSLHFSLCGDHHDHSTMPTILNSALALPPATRGLTLTLIGCSTVYFFLRLNTARKDPGGVLDHVGDAGTTVPWLTLVPSNVVYAPWTLLSSGFTETNLIEVRSSLTLILTLMIKLT